MFGLEKKFIMIFVKDKIKVNIKDLRPDKRKKNI